MNGLYIGGGALALALAVISVLEKRIKKAVIDDLKKYLISAIENKVADFKDDVKKITETYIVANFLPSNQALVRMVSECKELQKSLGNSDALRVISDQTKEYSKVMDERIQRITEDKIAEMRSEMDERLKGLESNDRTRKLIEEMIHERFRGKASRRSLDGGIKRSRSLNLS